MLPPPYSALGFADPVSSATHLVAAAVAAAAAVSLVRRGRGTPQRISLAIFAAGAVLCFSMSGVYHMLPHGSGGRAVLRRLDHAGIWVLIAATFTPIHVVLFQGWRRWGVLSLVWTIAIAGIVLKTIFFSMPDLLGAVAYLALGWLGIVGGFELLRRRHPPVGDIVAGGLLYTAGTLADVWNRPVLIPRVLGPHELLHLGVIGGLFLHWRFLARHVAGARPPAG